MASNNKKFQDLDQCFEHFLDTVQTQFVESDFTADKRTARRKRADADDLEFCKIYFPTIFNLPWNELHRKTANVGPGIHTRSGFRKCGKSAFVYTAYVIKPIAQGIGGLCGVDCETLEISTERTAALVRLMLRNKLLCYDYDIQIVQDLKGFYIVQGSKNATYLVAVSLNKSLRSYMDDEYKRFVRLVCDDLYGKDSVTSINHCDKVVDHVEYEVAGQLEDDGIAFVLGNATSEKAPIVTLRERRPDNHFGLPALNDSDESTWPEYRTTEEWQEFFKTKPWDVVAGDFMDKPAVKGDIFEPDWLRPVNINTMKILASISVCDPAHGESPSACFKAVWTLSMTNKHEIICRDVYLRKENYFQMFDYVGAVSGKIENWKVLLFENDFNQWAFAEPYYRDWVSKREKTIPIIRHHASQLATEHRSADKDSRILNLVHPHQTGMIVYDERILQTPDFERYKSQYLSYGKAKEKLDGLDALATAYIMIFRYVETNSFKPVKKRTFAKLDWFRRA